MRIGNLINGLDAIGKERSDHRCVGIAEVISYRRKNVAPFLKENYLAKIRLRQIAVGGVPLGVLFEEDNVVPTSMQCP